MYIQLLRRGRIRFFTAMFNSIESWEIEAALELLGLESGGEYSTSSRKSLGTVEIGLVPGLGSCPARPPHPFTPTNFNHPYLNHHGSYRQGD
jgi:hypothetical protein